MPHIIVERTRDLCVCSLPRRKDFPLGALLVETLDIMASVIFITGSVQFLPKYSKDVHNFMLGCQCFLVGSIIYVFVTGYTLTECLLEKGVYALEVFENVLYMVGSLCFIYGTFLFLPEAIVEVPNTADYPNVLVEVWSDPPPDVLALSQSKSYSLCDLPISHYHNYFHQSVMQTSLMGIVHVREMKATVLFIFGSLLFCMAAFTNALSQKRFNDAISVMLTAITFLYMSGSILFAMGSVAFLPDLGCGEAMVSLGAYAFILGSVLFLVGSVLSFARTVMLIRAPKERELLSLDHFDKDMAIDLPKSYS